MNDLATIETQLAGTEIATLLPPDISPDKFRSVALAAIRNNPELLKCDPRSLFNACMDAAQDGLLPDGREGAIVPRKGRAVWQSMIRGIYKRIKSGGSVSALSVNVVYEGEEFAVLLGDEDRIVHRRDLSKVHHGQEVAVYAIATLKDGCKEREVMTWDQVEQVRRSSSMPNSGPWTQWGDEMARKTVVRRLAKRLPVIEPADEAVHRTIERVDSLYDFGAKPADAPTVEHEANAANTYPQQVGQSAIGSLQQPGLRAAAAAMPAAPRKRQTIADWLEAHRIALADCESREAVDEILESEEMQRARETFTNGAKTKLEDMISEALGRWYEQPTEEEAQGDDLEDIAALALP